MDGNQDRVFVFTDGRVLDEAGKVCSEHDLLSHLEQSKRPLVLDLGKVAYLSSAAVGKLIMLNRKLASQQHRIQLRNVGPEVVEVFKMTRLNTFFET